MASAPMGSGGRFKALESALAAKGAQNPAGLAAAIGRRKLGKARFQALAAKGQRRANDHDADDK